MENHQNNLVVDLWRKYRPEIKELLLEAFVWHTIDNRGLLTSPRRGSQVATQIYELASKFLADEIDEDEVAQTVTGLAEKGMSIVTGTRMMGALGKSPWLDSIDLAEKTAVLQKINRFQVLFLENLAGARELANLRIQERSQNALQQALHTQLEQQRQMRLNQEVRNQNLNKILRLNTNLARITNEAELLDQAAEGVCQALNLADVTIYEYLRPELEWGIRTKTRDGELHDSLFDPQLFESLNDALSGSDEIINRFPLENDQELLIVTIILRIGKLVLGAMIFKSNPLESGSHEEFLILIRTFAQNLAALWRNIVLLTETRQRSHELEILHGRYIDQIWSKESSALIASYGEAGFKVNRKSELSPFPSADSVIPLRIGNHSVGHIELPGEVNLSFRDMDFIQSLSREMGNALNTAYLLQATSSYSNQLSLAVEVSRAATTILDQDLLIQEVVELIRSRFGFAYVGLFLVDEKNEMAILKAGTGEAGRLQVESGHKLEIGGSSMIGTAVATGRSFVEQDVSKAEKFSFNIFLPDTRSEVALPLRRRGEVIGALTVQSNELGAFTDDTIRVLQSLADQLAVTILNAQLFEEIQSSNEQLRQLDHLKNQFLANMSHELRTPLNSIIGFSRVILKGIDGPITPDQEEDLTSIYNNGHHLLTLINEILDMAKIEAGKMSLAFEMVDLEESARDSLTTIRGLVDEEKVELIWDVVSGLPQVEADPVRIRQILMNLLSNAAKFTQEGFIRLQIEQDKDNIHIAVHDSGIGIAPENYEKLFTPFEQIDNSTTRVVGGTGLGLPITRWLVNSHNGEIWVESEINQGATFHVTIPIAQEGTTKIDTPFRNPTMVSD